MGGGDSEPCRSPDCNLLWDPSGKQARESQHVTQNGVQGRLFTGVGRGLLRSGRCGSSANANHKLESPP